MGEMIEEEGLGRVRAIVECASSLRRMWLVSLRSREYTIATYIRHHQVFQRAATYMIKSSCYYHLRGNVLVGRITIVGPTLTIMAYTEQVG